jgi:hypothetical protein
MDYTMSFKDFKRLQIVPRRKSSIDSAIAFQQDEHPVLRFRKRSLTIPISNPAKVGLLRKKPQETYDQLQCPLFGVLPYDIRIIIWELVIGGFHVHVFDWSRKLGHLICSPFEKGPARAPSVCLGPLDYGHTHGVLHRPPNGFLALLKTCRRT